MFYRPSKETKHIAQWHKFLRPSEPGKTQMGVSACLFFEATPFKAALKGNQAKHNNMCGVPLFGCGSTMRTQNGTLVNGTKNENMRSPGGFILTHTVPIWTHHQPHVTSVKSRGNAFPPCSSQLNRHLAASCLSELIKKNNLSWLLLTPLQKVYFLGFSGSPLDFPTG